MTGLPRRVLAVATRAIAGERRHEDAEFLPAALEVVETPPSPVGRAMALTIGLFLLVALIWSVVGRVDIVATASGSVLPAGMVKVVQAADGGIVRAINVQDGDRVRRGDLLIALDPTVTGADQRRASQDLVRAELDVARLRALAGLGGFAGPADAPADAIAEARAATRAAEDEQRARIADLDEQIRDKAAERAGADAEITQLQAVLPILAQKDEIHEQLHRKGFSTTFAYLDARQTLTASRLQMKVLHEKARQAEAEHDALVRQRETARSGFLSRTLADLSAAEQRRDQLLQEVVKARQRTRQSAILSPIDGVVEQLAVHTLGGVVTPAQRLLTVVPGANRLMVQALLANRDVGFVHPGQPVQIKVEAFNFTKYGLLPGTVVEVARDAVDRGAAAAAAGPAEAAADRPEGGEGLFYVVRIAPARGTMTIDGAPRTLVPGMAVTAEIRTGRRSIISYLLSPLARRSSESLRER